MATGARRRGGGRAIRRHSTGTPTAPRDSPSSPRRPSTELQSHRSPQERDAADIAAALVEARRLMNSGIISESEVSAIEKVDSMNAASSASFERIVRSWMALTPREQSPASCAVIVKAMLDGNEPLLAFDFLREHVEPRGWLLHHSSASARANARSSPRGERSAKGGHRGATAAGSGARSGHDASLSALSARGGAASPSRRRKVPEAEAAVLSLRELHARTLFEVGSLQAAKGILLEIHAEGRSDLPMLSLLGRTLKYIAVSSLERGHLEAAKSEMVLTQKICLEAFRRAKIEASLVLSPHPQRSRPSGGSGDASAYARWSTENTDSASFASGDIAMPSPSPDARAQWEQQCVALFSLVRPALPYITDRYRYENTDALVLTVSTPLHPRALAGTRRSSQRAFTTTGVATAEQAAAAST